MRRGSFVAEDHIKAFNILRLKYGKTFSEEEFREDLRNNNIPSNPLFFLELIKSGVIIKIDKNVYSFSNPKKPIHYRVLQHTYEDYQTKINNYQRLSRERKRKKEVLEQLEIKKAIELLKSHGFEIYTPVKDFYSKVK